MKQGVFAAVLALACVFTVLPASAQTAWSVAPADRYFGRLQMSILEIRNSLKDLSALAQASPDRDGYVFGKAQQVEDALRSWAKQFPHDPWIPKFSVSLADLYGKLNIDQAQSRRVLMLNWLNANYPGAWYLAR
jgi:hypothetical protein